MMAVRFAFGRLSRHYELEMTSSPRNEDQGALEQVPAQHNLATWVMIIR